MKYTFLNGNNVAADAEVIIRDHEQHNDNIYILTDSTTLLYAYIGALECNGVNNAIMFNLKICREMKGIDLSFVHNGKGEQKVTSISALIGLLDGTPCSVIVNDNSRETLAEVSQQLIYVGYPLTSVNIMLRKEAKDAEKTQRFMTQINDISSAIDKAVIGIDKISAEWDGSDKLPDDKKQECIDLIGEARQRCIAIQEKVAKAKNVEMTVAVAASKKTGKSVIVNSMIGEEIAPTSLLLPTPNTCIYTRSPDEKYHLILNDEPQRNNVIQKRQTDYSTGKEIYDILNKEFQDSVAGNKPVVDMTIQYPTSGNNFESFTIYDTPGPDFSADEKHALAAKRAMKTCDVAVFAIDYTKYLTDGEKKYLEEVKTEFNENQKFASLIFAINKLDQKYTDPTGNKSTIYAIDFIRHQLMNLGDMYKDCIVFATSAIQYYDTLHCEKTIGSEFSQLDDLYDLRKIMHGQPDNISFELQFLQNMASIYSNQMGLEKVSPADMKQYSGMPDLLSYAEYICKSKARDEIVNNITVTIDANNKALKAISQNIESIDKLITAEESQIQKIKSIIDEYTESVMDKLTDKVFRSELRANGAKKASTKPGAGEDDYRSLDFYFNAINTEVLTFSDIEDYTRTTLLSKFNSDSAVYKDIFDIIEIKSYQYIKEQLSIQADDKGRITGDKLQKVFKRGISDQVLIDCINQYIVEQINAGMDQHKQYINGLSCSITTLLNNRIDRIEEASDKCRKALEKLDTPLELPELPDFSFELPEINIIPSLDSNKITLNININSFMSLIKKEDNGFVNFLRTFFKKEYRGQQLYYYEEELSSKDFHDEFIKQYRIIVDSLTSANAYSLLCEENEKMANELNKTIDFISDQLNEIIDLMKSSIVRFSNLIDDTRSHKENIDYHNAQKELINELMDCSDGFSKEWDKVLTSFDIEEEVIK